MWIRIWKGPLAVILTDLHRFQRCLPFTSTLFTHTGIAYTFTISKIHHILRIDGLMGLKFWLVIGINIHKLGSKYPPEQKLLAEKQEKY